MMDTYRHRDFGHGVLMTAEMASLSRYSKPTLWTRYHIVVVAPSPAENGERGACKKMIHYGFDSKETAERVWDQLVSQLEMRQDKLEFLSNFDVNDLGLHEVEGRIVKYLEKGKVWSVFPLKN